MPDTWRGMSEVNPDLQLLCPLFRGCEPRPAAYAAGMQKLFRLTTLSLAPAVFLIAADTSPLQERADRFLALVNSAYQAIYYVEAKAVWAASTDVKPEHDAAAETAGKARAAFVGNPAIIDETRTLLLHRHELNDVTIRQLQRLLLLSAEGPMTNPVLTQARIAAETFKKS